MNEPRLQIPAGLAKHLDYPKFVGPTRMLIFKTEYFFDASWKRAAESMGWQVETAPSAMAGGLTRDEIQTILHTITEFRPHFIIASNFAGMDAMGLFARFFEDARIPYVSWFTDSPRMILYDRTVHCSHYTVAATWERDYTPQLEEFGFEHIHFMPLATDPTLFNGQYSDSHEHDVGFVGISMIDIARDAWEKLGQSPEVAGALRTIFDNGDVSRACFAQGMQNVVGQDVLDMCDVRARRHVELTTVYEATKRLRCNMVEALLPFNVRVCGDPEWRAITPNSCGELGYFDALAPFFRTTAVNVNSTSLQMSSAVNQRVFDCPAAGGFLITDAQGDLEELFDPDEVVTYATLDELRDKAGYYLKHPAERKAIAEKAQRRVLTHHTIRHRLEELEAYLKERYR